MTEFTNALAHIKKHGDTIDNHPETTHALRGRLTTVLGNVALAMPAGVSAGSYFMAGELDVAASAYLVYTPLVLTGNYVYNRRRDKIRLDRSLRASREIAEILDEPVDVLGRKTDNGRELSLRWYAFDNIGDDTLPRDFVRRSYDILQAAREHDIDSVALALPDAVRPAGKGLGQDAYLARLKLWDELHVNDRDPMQQDKANIAYFMTDDFGKFLAEYTHERDESLLKDIVEMLKNATISEKYSMFLAEGKSPAASAALQRALRSFVERNGQDVEMLPEKQPDGTVLRTKAHNSLKVLPGNKVQNISAVEGTTTGEPQLHVGMSAHLAEIVGMTNEQLLEFVETSGPAALSELELSTAALLILDRKNDYIGQNPPVRDTTAVPLWSRAENLHVNSKVESRGVKQFFMAVGGIALGLTLSIGAGVAHEQSPDNVVADSSHEIVSGANNLHGELSDSIFDMLVSGAETLSNRIHGRDKYEGWLYRLGQSDADGTDSYARQRGHTDFGDVEGSGSGKNQSVYSIQPLTGKSSEGLWSTDTYDRIMVIDTPIVSGPGNLSMYYTGQGERQPEMVPADEVDSVQPDFAVETTRLSLALDRDNVAMPVRLDSRVVAAEVADLKNPKKKFEAGAWVSQNDSGEYSFMADQVLDTMASMDMEQPALRYWTKIDDDSKSDAAHESARYAEKFEFYVGNDEQQWRPRAYVTNEVRGALGLDDMASSSEVLEAIRAKQYSYTPLKDNHFDDPTKDAELSLERSTDSELLIAEAGAALARLESMNCNVANLTMLMGNMYTSQFAGMGGFSENGDGHLSTNESHFWLMDTTGNVVDATPPGSGDDEAVVDEEKHGDTNINMEQAASVILGGVFTYVAWRRRRQIGEKLDAVRTGISTGTPGMRKTIRDIESDVYGDPNKPEPAQYAEPLHDQAETVRRYAFNLPDGTKVGGSTVPEALRRAFLQLNDAAIRRHAARATPQPDRPYRLPSSGAETLEF